MGKLWCSLNATLNLIVVVVVVYVSAVINVPTRHSRRRGTISINKLTTSHNAARTKDVPIISSILFASTPTLIVAIGMLNHTSVRNAARASTMPSRWSSTNNLVITLL